MSQAQRAGEPAGGGASPAFPIRPMLVLCAAQLIFVGGFQMSSIALPDIQADLGMGDAALQWVSSAQALALAALVFPAGRLVDRYGGRIVFQIGAAGLVLTSLAAALSRTTAQLLVARAAEGAAVALLMGAMFALITHLTPEPEHRVKALAWWGVAGSMGGALGVVLGGALISAAGWQALFFLTAVVTAPVALLSRGLPASERDRRRPLDLPGAALATGAMAAAVLGLSRLTIGDLTGLALLAAAVGLGAALLAVERRVDAPLLPPAILGDRAVAGVTAVALLQSMVTNTPLYFFAIYMQELEGRSAAATGLAFLPCNLALVAGSNRGGWLTAKIGAARATALGLAVVAVGHLVLVRLPEEGGYAMGFLPELVLLGFGLGVSQVAIAAVLTTSVPTAYAGLASSVSSATSQLGRAVGLAILVGVVAASGGDLGESVTGYRWVFAAAAVLAGVSAVATPILMRPRAAGVRAERTESPAAAGHPAR